MPVSPLKLLQFGSALVLSAIFIGAHAAEPAVAATAPDETVGAIKLRDESLEQVLALLERWTGRSVLRPQALPTATFTLTTTKPMTRAEAVRALETLLSLNGIAISPLGDKFLKVTPMAQARTEAPEMIDGSTLGLVPSGRIATKLFQLDFLRVQEFSPQVQPLLNPAMGGGLVAFDKTNALLITDSISNLQRVESLLKQVDRPALGNLEPKFYSINFAKASDVVNKMRAVLSGSLTNQLGAATTFSADDRTNQIIVVSDPRQYAFFDQLIGKLDVKADPNTKNEILHLKHASAPDVATLLSNLVAGQSKAMQEASAAAARIRGPGIAQPTVVPGSPNAVQVPSPASAASGLELNVDHKEFSSFLTILPDERSNSIVVSGTLDDIRLITELVEKIDIILAQVRIEVVIAEVTLTDDKSSGIDSLGLSISDGKVVGFSGAGPGFSVANGVLTKRPDGSTSLAAELGFSTTPRLNNANILSVPTILTTHNKKASIFVGESRPVISSYLNDNSGNTGGSNIGSGYRSTVTPQEIGISLTVTPLIGTDGSVQMEIKQTVDDVLGEIIIDGNPQPRIGKREAESFVIVKNGEIAVLGGLQRNSTTKSTNRLGPIPFIGDLLGSRKSQKSRTDLVFFLRPYVLTNTPDDNLEALQRIERGPQKDAVREALAPASAKAAVTPHGTH